MNNLLQGQNASVDPMMEAKANRPEDGYLIPAQLAEWMSEDSLEVMRHFGLEAPDLLNKYSNALEDSLIKAVEERAHLQKQVDLLTCRLHMMEAARS
jgi:hypothetical protein